MGYSTGKLLFIFVVAVVLSALGAWIIAARYRATMLALMSGSAGAGAATDAAAAPSGAAAIAPWLVPASGPAATLAANRRAGWRLTIALLVLSLLVATSSAALQLLELLGVAGWSVKRLGVLAAVQLWPVLPALAIVWRWSRLRLLFAFVAFLVASFLLMLWRSEVAQPLMLLRYLALEVGLPLFLIAPLCLGSSTRAVVPWLLPPMAGLVWASIAGIDGLAYFLQRKAAWLMSLSDAIGAEAVWALFALVPWLIAWWPLQALGRAFARAYTARAVSELSVQFTVVWIVQLTFVALGAASDRGLGGLVMLLPALWIPFGFAVLASRRPGAARPPTLLVLRVFQHDAAVRDLFDHVVERWRLTGNTVLIAGTDLVDRTLDVGDVLTFLDRRLGQRFVNRPADIAARIAEFDLLADLEGRFRINECYCRDSTWREAFAALAARSDIVVMDLRGFQARNVGCLHELASLARAERVGRVVVLTNADTDRATADAAVAGAPAERFSWVDVRPGTRLDHRQLLARLFPAAPAAPALS
jgi:hypothetical protein